MAAAASSKDPIVVFGTMGDDYQTWAMDVHMDVTRPLVDYFVIIEMDHTFTSVSRMPRFEELGKRHDNVIWRWIHSPCVKNAFFNEFVQRDMLSNVVNELRAKHPDRTFAVCVNDVDEFIDPSSFESVRAWATSLDTYDTASIPMIHCSRVLSRMCIERWLASIVIRVPPSVKTPRVCVVRWSLSDETARKVLRRNIPTSIASEHLRPKLELPCPNTFGFHLNNMYLNRSELTNKHASITYTQDTKRVSEFITEWVDPECRRSSNGAHTAAFVHAEKLLALMHASLATSLRAHIPSTSLVRSFVPLAPPSVVIWLAEPLISDIDVCHVETVAMRLFAEYGDALNVILARCRPECMPCACWYRLARVHVLVIHWFDIDGLDEQLFLHTTCVRVSWRSL